MSGINVSKSQLQNIAKHSDWELSVRPGDDEQNKLVRREGNWGGRMVRNLKVSLGNDPRETQKREYGGAKETIESSLKKIYGEEIGARAFRAGVGHLDDQRNWSTSSDFPLTGRHVAKMLETAERLQRAKSVGEWVGDMVGEEGPRELERGEKLSQPLGQRTLSVAAHAMKNYIDDDVELQLKGEQRHGVWVLDFAPRGGPGPARMYVHIDRDNPDTINVRGVRGERHQVPGGEFGDWLHKALSSYDGGIQSMELHRIVDRARVNQDEPIIISEGDQDDIDRVEPPRVGGGDQVARQGWQPEGWRDMIDHYRVGVTGDRAGVEGDGSGHSSERLDSNLKERKYLLEFNGKSNPLEHVWQIAMAVERPGGGMALQGPTLAAFTRFLDDNLFRTAYANLFPGSGEPDVVEISVRTRFGDDNRPVFDVTFRAPVPETDEFKDVDNRFDLHLGVTVHVPYDQMRKSEPQFTIDNPQIELLKRERPEPTKPVLEDDDDDNGSESRDQLHPGPPRGNSQGVGQTGGGGVGNVPPPGGNDGPGGPIVGRYRQRVLDGGDDMDKLDVIAEALKEIYGDSDRGDDEQLEPLARAVLTSLLSIARMPPIDLPSPKVIRDSDDLGNELSGMPVFIPPEQWRSINDELTAKLESEVEVMRSIMHPTPDLPPSLQQDMRTRQLFVQVGDRETERFGSLQSLRTIRLEDDFDSRVLTEILPSHRTALARLMHVGLFDSVYRTVAKELTGGEQEPLPDRPVHFLVTASIDEFDGAPTFTIRISGDMDDDVVSNLKRDEGDRFELSVTLEVPTHQLEEDAPVFRLKDATLERIEG